MKGSKFEVFQGFLGFYVFILILSVFSPIFQVVRFSLFLLPYYMGTSGNSYVSTPAGYSIVWILYIIMMLFSFYTLYLTFSKKEIARLFNIVYIWVAFLFPFVYEYILSFFSPNDGLRYAGSIFFSIFSLPWAIIWTIYFVKSKRVMDTFIR